MQLKRRNFLGMVTAAATSTSALAAPAPQSATSRQPASGDAISVGSQRQLLFDDFYFDSQQNLRFTLHKPEMKEVVLWCDQPWEKKVLHYPVVIHDGSKFRMWYRIDEGDPTRDLSTDQTWSCYAESSDGIHWEKPKLGLVSWRGSRENNIFLPTGLKEMNSSVLLDRSAPENERYKMITKTTPGPKRQEVASYVSGDGLRWRPVDTNPILPNKLGPFDSHNILLWDDERRRYVIYLRGTDRSVPGPFDGGRRAVRRSESEDFRHWSNPELVLTGDSHDPADFHIYTNAAMKYERAQRAFFMFPMILHEKRRYPGQPNRGGLSEVIFATSRDGIKWNRQFREPFMRPGLDERNWVDRNPIVGSGIVQTGPAELSLYYSDLFRSPETRIRRATLRMDGLVSVDGPYEGWGEFTTRPLLFDGKRLALNFSTTGGGTIKVELQNENGTAIRGFATSDCEEIFGDHVDRAVRWKEGDQVASLAGKPVRMHVQLRDAQLYAFRFGD